MRDQLLMHFIVIITAIWVMFAAVVLFIMKKYK